MRLKNSGLNLAIMNLFIVFLGVGLVIPIMPLLQEEMQLSGTTMGLLVSIFAMSQLIASPITGYLSDKIGRTQLITIGMFLFGISELIFGLGHDVLWLYISRGLGGIAAAMIMPSVTAYVADSTSIKERPKAMGLVSAAISGGFIIGPGIGGMIANLGIRAPFYLAAILGFMGSVLAFFVLKEPQKRKKDSSIREEVSFLEVLKNPLFTFPFVIILISSFGLQAFESIYSIMAVANFGFSMTQIALIIMVSGGLALFFQIVFFDKLIYLMGEVGLIRTGFFLSAIFIGVISFTNSSILIIISTFIVFLSFDLLRPAITTYLSKYGGSMQGTVNGLNSTFTSIGNIFGPMIAGALFDVNHFFPYYLSALILLVTSFLSLLWKKEAVIEELSNS